MTCDPRISAARVEYRRRGPRGSRSDRCIVACAGRKCGEACARGWTRARDGRGKGHDTLENPADIGGGEARVRNYSLG
eukprot:scaffold6794_cov96-Isochrysis_galbana.AAC.1